MKENLEFIIKALVEKKEEVQIEETSSDYGGITYNIKVSPEDIGRIIGKSGKTIKSLRTIFKAAGLRNNQKIRLEIVEDENFKKEKPVKTESPVESPTDETATETPSETNSTPLEDNIEKELELEIPEN